MIVRSGWARGIRVATVALVMTCAACSVDPSPDPTDTAAPAVGAADGFPAGAPLDYQLGGAYPPPSGVRIVVRDSAATPAPGTYGVCYVNAFQTQPQLAAGWLADHPDLVLRNGSGPVVDPDWPDEYLLDTSTPDKRDRIATIVGETVRGCARSGFRAVELDNLDSATRSDGALTDDQNLQYAAALVRIGHDAGLLVGQKNAADLGGRARAEAGFDFAVAEECVAFDECGAYAAAYGDRVLAIEYTDNVTGDPCATADRPRSTVVRDRGLVPSGAPGYAYRQC